MEEQTHKMLHVVFSNSFLVTLVSGENVIEVALFTLRHNGKRHNKIDPRGL